jgi:hypothetical protein
MFGRLPWLAFERRIRAFFFFVFFDIVPTRYRQTQLITPSALNDPTRPAIRIGNAVRPSLGTGHHRWHRFARICVRTL